MTRTRAIVLLASLLIMGALAALSWQKFTGGAEVISVRRVVIDVESAALAGGVDREAVRALTHMTIGETRGFKLAPDAPGSALRVVVEAINTQQPPMPAGHPPVAATTSLTMSVELIDDGQTIARGRAVASAQGDIDREALLRNALRDAVRQVHLVKAADRLDSDELLRWFGDPDISDAQRSRAMQALASRGDRRLTAALTSRLEQELQDGEAAALLQALALLGDPASIDAVIAYSERRPAAIRKLCIDVVKASASARGVPWLFTLSSGHPDSEVQAYARAALAHLAPDLSSEFLPSGG
jgi:hypothetical protein